MLELQLLKCEINFIVYWPDVVYGFMLYDQSVIKFENLFIFQYNVDTSIVKFKIEFRKLENLIEVNADHGGFNVS